MFATIPHWNTVCTTNASFHLHILHLVEILYAKPIELWKLWGFFFVYSSVNLVCKSIKTRMNWLAGLCILGILSMSLRVMYPIKRYAPHACCRRGRLELGGVAAVVGVVILGELAVCLCSLALSLRLPLSSQAECVVAFLVLRCPCGCFCICWVVLHAVFILWRSKPDSFQYAAEV